LIEELLALARADSGREGLDLACINLSEALSKALTGWRQVASVRNLRFVTSLPSEDFWVLADEAKLRRVLSTLLDNAFKYTPSPGTIEIGFESAGDKAVIVVRDTGIGISGEDRPRIFERFYRAERARSRELCGTGLGLAIAQWIVQQHHGSIKVDSTLGEGSVFRVELPLTTVTAHSRLTSAKRS
jgi:signal transduction histidine kinase